MSSVAEREHCIKNNYYSPTRIHIQNYSSLRGTTFHTDIVTTLVMQKKKKKKTTWGPKLFFLTVGYVMFKVHHASLHNLQQNIETLEAIKRTYT